MKMLPPPTSNRTALHSMVLLLFVTLMSVGPGSADLVANARERLEAGTAAEQRGEYIVAVQRYREALELNPNYTDAFHGLARSFFRLAEYEQALDAVREARRRARTNTTIASLEGDILLLLGRLNEAAEAYNRVLAIEPNNLAARIGLAELSVAEGRTSAAIDTYRTILSLAPENRPAILSLAVLYDERGDSEAAERYLALALEFHPRDPFVHELLSRYYLRSGRYGQARVHAETAVALSPGFARGWDLLTRTELAAGNYEAAVNASERLISLTSDSSMAFYLLGLAYERLDRFDESLDAYDRALRIAPDDEIARYALESTVTRGYDLEDPVRENVAQYRFGRAASLIQQNQLIQAHAEFRRGLMLNPFDRDGRFQFAQLQRQLGFDGKLLAELQVLEQLGYQDNEIREAIELYEYLRRPSIASTWSVDQFSIERERMNFSMFYTHDHGADSRPASGRFVAEHLRHRLLGSELIEIEELPGRISTPEQAFERARASGTEYFIILTFREEDRTVDLSVDILHSATGTRVRQIRVSRTGSGAVPRAGAAVADRIESMIPTRGRLLERRGREALVSIGRADGVSEGDELIVIRSSRLASSVADVGFRYDPSDQIGTITVTALDDLLAIGRLQREGFFDLFAIGDTVLLNADDQIRTIEDRPAFSPLYWRIREIR